jgi:outer membrane protein OmpA-like peptidoglycan-associated protein
MFLPRSARPHITDSVPGLGTAAPLAPGLWSRPFMEPIVFASGQADTDPDQAQLLDELALSLSWFSTSCTIEIAGHAWGEGSDDEQRALSRRRAEAVRDALTQRGLHSEVLRVKAYGSDRPVTAERHAEQEAVRASRRVEIWLHQRTASTRLPCSEPGAEDCCRAC